ncbi:major facilitator superfamily domain-containing protein [Massariosphaeria phaeospora]|uniref:Major facilitator superfamily domain-containing protein n=1 Tax=Massariosphaeria phaeospora TaxID=100035 RepID=A0A7C8M9X4_9PLEO|nr:major facilitator superfamily domain-containing protein [Massariosphaeria phaeospora]
MAITTEQFGSAQDVDLQALDTNPDSALDAVDETTALSRDSILKIVAAGFSFFFAGMNDGSLGALVPYILRTYHVRTEHVALIYASTFFGWLLAAATNSHLASHLGLGAILIVGAVLQLVAHILRFWTPPFGLYVATFFLQAAGMAYQDTHSNTFVASTKGAHRWLGFIHAMYALGCLISPFVATGIASRAKDRWPLFYLPLAGIAVINIVAVLVTFRDSLVIHSRPSSSEETEGPVNRNKNPSQIVVDTLKTPGVYFLSLFYFFMLGVGITTGGWLVEYLISARNGQLPDVGYVPAGLYGGIFFGRVLLAEPTHRFGERRMTMGYCVLILVFQLVFWLVPNLVSSAVAICLLGFFFGPMFATGMSIGSKLFDKRIQSTALGFIFVLAQAGGSLFPAFTGVIASRAGVKVLQPMLLGLIVAMAFAWALVPTVPRRDE